MSHKPNSWRERGSGAGEGAGKLQTALMDAGGNGFGGNALTGGLPAICRGCSFETAPSFTRLFNVKGAFELESRFIPRGGARMSFRATWLLYWFKK